MDIQLNDIEVRVLGSLMEKEMATPEYYPLSLNALTNACNQKSNRDPVVSYDEITVVRAIDGLKEKQLALQSDASRVPKYEQNFTRPRNLVNREAAVLAVLFLRGSHTVGEIKGRTDRLYKFTDLEEVSETLFNLADLGYVKELPLQPGRKEHRYAHLLCSEPDLDEVIAITHPESATMHVRTENERIADLEDEVNALRHDLNDMQQAFNDFKQQFE